MPNYSCSMTRTRTSETIQIGDKPYVLFGRDANLAPDVVIDHPSVSRRHAALVHHHNGRSFVIDLASVCMCVCVCSTRSCMKKNTVYGYRYLDLSTDI